MGSDRLPGRAARVMPVRRARDTTCACTPVKSGSVPYDTTTESEYVHSHYHETQATATARWRDGQPTHSVLDTAHASDP
eukprot:709917-Prymnesium_polylepis.1